MAKARAGDRGGVRRAAARPVEGVFAADELGFGHVTDDPREAVERIVRALPRALRERLRPIARVLDPTAMTGRGRPA